MRSTLDLLAYIDEQYELMLDRPQMYAADPAMLEAMFSTLERVREFVLSETSQRDPSQEGYTQFSISKGFGALGFTSRYVPPENGAAEASPTFDDLCTFWREFVHSPFRRRSNEATNGDRSE